MLKTISLFYILLIFIDFSAQVSTYSGKPTGYYGINGKNELDPEQLKEFKKNTTLFILSTEFSKEEYEMALKDSWTITKTRIVNQDYDLTNNKENINVVRFKGLQVTGPNGTYKRFYLDIESINHSEKDTTSVAKIVLFNKDHSNFNDGYVFNAREKFYNYNLGLLKNYFQELNLLLSNGKTESSNELYHSDELNNILSKNTLLIPEYILSHYSCDFSDYKEQVFKNYPYDIKLIKNNELSDKIISGDEVYYLRFVKMHIYSYIQVVNSKTGEVLYKNNFRLSFKKNIELGEIKELIKTLKKLK